MGYYLWGVCSHSQVLTSMKLRGSLHEALGKALEHSTRTHAFAFHYAQATLRLQ